MTAEQLLALERIASDSRLLSGLIERTMIQDASMLNDRAVLAEIRQAQCSLATIHSVVERMIRDIPPHGLELRRREAGRRSR